MKFQTEKYADVSTAHVKLNDMVLLEQLSDSPKENTNHGLGIYVLSYKEGAFVRFSPQIITKEINEFLPKMIEAGFSLPFIKIIGAAAKQGIAMVRFDCDGSEMEGVQKFDW